MMRQASLSPRDGGTEPSRPVARSAPLALEPAIGAGRAHRHTVQVRASFRRLPRGAAHATPGRALDTLN